MRAPNAVLWVMLASCSGCWSWSFPETLLNEGEDDDAGAPVDDAGEGGEGGEAEGGSGEGGTGDGGAGGIAGGTAGQGGKGGSAQGGAGGDVGCGVGRPCPSNAPVCSPSGQCRLCTAHDQCAGGLCTLQGLCPSESEITHVSDQCPPTATRDGTRAKPLCELKEALGREKPFIFVSRGAFQDIVVASAKQLYGDINNATLQSPSCSALTIEAKGVQVVGFNIAGGVTLKSESKAKLVNNRIVSSACVGVTAEAGADLAMERNLVRLNQRGGVDVFGPAYTLINNIIVENGSSGSTSTEFGGVRLHQASSNLVGFVNNTVVDNAAKGGDKDPAAVRCDVKADIVSSIIWSRPMTATLRQLSALCAPSHSVIPAGEGAMGTGNIFSDPKLLSSNQVAGTPAYYQLAADSPALDKAASGAPPYDFLGQPRGTKPDIGALERTR